MKLKATTKKSIIVKEQPENQSGKQIKITVDNRKHTPKIYNELIEVIKLCHGAEFDIHTSAEAVSDILFKYAKNEGKEAVNMIFEDDMDTFRNEKKDFRVFAQDVLKEGRKIAKTRIKSNDRLVKNLVNDSKEMQAAFSIPKDERPIHPMGKGKDRVKNELRLRPKFLAQDVKFKVLRVLGVY